MTDRNCLYAGAAIAVIAAGALGFGAARVSQPAAPAPALTAAVPPPAAPSDTVEIDADAIRASAITVAPAAAGELDMAVPASATVQATPEAEAVLTARAPGTITRILKRIGDPVRVGDTLAMVESLTHRRSPPTAPLLPRVCRSRRNSWPVSGRSLPRVSPRAPITRPRKPTSRSHKRTPGVPAPLQVPCGLPPTAGRSRL